MSAPCLKVRGQKVDDVVDGAMWCVPSKFIKGNAVEAFHCRTDIGCRFIFILSHAHP